MKNNSLNNNNIRSLVSNTGPGNITTIAVDLFADLHFKASDIGDWQGEEELATRKLNRILDMINKSLPEYTDRRTVEEIQYQVWKHWSSTTRILDTADLELKLYALNTTRTYIYELMPGEAA